MSSWIFKDANEKSPPDPKAARRRALLLSAPFVLMGLFALVLLVHDGWLGGLNLQTVIKLLSVIIVSAGFPALIFGITAKKNSRAARHKPPVPETTERPWLKREDWAAGRVTSGTRKGVFFIWAFAFFWIAVSAPVVLRIPAEWNSGHHAILIALLFPVVGLGMIVFAVNTTRAWRKFGQSVFEMAAIPGAPGGTLEGEIQVKTKLQPRHGWHLRLSCLRRTTTGGGKNRSTTEKIIWQDEKWLRADLPQTDLNATGIPVYFRLPAGLPESTVSPGDGIHWRLEASATLRGPDFHAAFDVPVFNLSETPEISGDPTVACQMSLDEIRRQIHSKIQANDLPDGGREFVFPAARNPGNAAGFTLIWLAWTGIVAALFWNWKLVPRMVPPLFGAFDLLLTIGAFNLWFLRGRVVVTPERVTIQKSWLIFKTERRLAAADVAGFEAQPGMTAGHSVYYDLKIRTGGGDIIAASRIADKPEADWLARQMAAALKPVPATDSKA